MTDYSEAITAYERVLYLLGSSSMDNDTRVALALLNDEVKRIGDRLGMNA